MKNNNHRGRKNQVSSYSPDFIPSPQNKMKHFTNNQKFADKFNKAIKQLENDPYALITFGHCCMVVFEYMAKNNDLSLEDLVLKVVASYKEIYQNETKR